MLGDLQHYWSGSFLAANAFIGLNLAGALLLGMLVGYERSYNGRAAGMRTYGLVCMASTALTVFVGHASLWYGGTSAHIQPDPTRVVQGVVTGIGFLCAGVIMKDGMSIRGLTTAASIWAAAAIGVLLGVGFYAAALLLAVLCVASMSMLHGLESRLPGRMTLDLSLTFQPGEAPDFDLLIQRAKSRGYRVLNDTLTITYADNQALWRVSLVAPDKARALSPAALAAEMAATEGVSRFSIVPVRS
ncbi:MgtC/SapB family protein (plasmid) [Cupriavidus sp. KK10]|jgi:putative Mg2+ transporter-C (MgtC) family protein|uniref:MgtC/SapB family protein n=1 Tax=Cupriavidus sp. KK10 TaxID=1478019 RepID=UPI001BA707FB|nr:MgtC/SapB family protein [Cupriavidus sp. KK10]QUN32604.1 MgtC/SapB family protein [Cupriavidus sp. KK10]